MSVAPLNGSAGLIGSEVAGFFAALGNELVGIDNDRHREFFGDDEEQNRRGDHICWFSDNSQFSNHYPVWPRKHDVRSILQQIHDSNINRWISDEAA